MSAETLAGYTGDYAAVTHRFPWDDPADLRAKTARVFMDARGLFIERNGKHRHLIPAGTDLFRYPGETVPTSAFIEYEGRLYFQDENGNYVRTQR